MILVESACTRNGKEWCFHREITRRNVTQEDSRKESADWAFLRVDSNRRTLVDCPRTLVDDKRFPIFLPKLGIPRLGRRRGREVNVDWGVCGLGEVRIFAKRGIVEVDNHRDSDGIQSTEDRVGCEIVSDIPCYDTLVVGLSLRNAYGLGARGVEVTKCRDYGDEEQDGYADVEGKEFPTPLPLGLIYQNASVPSFHMCL